MLNHGGNLSFAAAQYGIPLEYWLDLSTGINPNGYPIPEIPPALWQRLPLDHDGLAEVACEYYGCHNALPVAGSQAALQILPKLRPFSKVAMLEPMYQEHRHAWRQNGHQVCTFEHLNDHVLNQVDVVLLCNPNNPTGQHFTPNALLNLHTKLASRNGWLVIDEAFMDASPELSVAKFSHLKGLIVLRSLGKFFGLAGARVGFLLGQPDLLNLALERLGPWTISGASRYIAKCALKDLSWQNQSQRSLIQASNRLSGLLKQYKLTPQSGTRLFQYVPTHQAELWHQQLAAQGVWVRLFGQPQALRFGLPSDNQWQKLELALSKIT